VPAVRLGSVIDLAFTTHPNLVVNMQIYQDLFMRASDHCPILIDLQQHINHPPDDGSSVDRRRIAFRVTGAKAEVGKRADRFKVRILGDDYAGSLTAQQRIDMSMDSFIEEILDAARTGYGVRNGSPSNKGWFLLPYVQVAYKNLSHALAERKRTNRSDASREAVRIAPCAAEFKSCRTGRSTGR